MVMHTLSLDLKDKNIKVFTINPGVQKTEKVGPASNFGPEQSVANIRSLIMRLTERDSGSFFDHSGHVLAW